MDINLKKPLPDNPRNVLRRAGYGEHFDPVMQKTSYSLRLGSGRYPRFHCYVKESDTTVSFSLHIDQKEASYEGAGHMHAGEYDGKLVEDEIGRIRRWASAPSEGGSPSEAPHGPAPKASEMQNDDGPKLPTSNTRPKDERSFFQRLFAGSKDNDE